MRPYAPDSTVGRRFGGDIRENRNLGLGGASRQEASAARKAARQQGRKACRA
jgi:hypothetical protein